MVEADSEASANLARIEGPRRAVLQDVVAVLTRTSIRKGIFQNRDVVVGGILLKAGELYFGGHFDRIRTSLIAVL